MRSRQKRSDEQTFPLPEQHWGHGSNDYPYRVSYIRSRLNSRRHANPSWYKAFVTVQRCSPTLPSGDQTPFLFTLYFLLCFTFLFTFYFPLLSFYFPLLSTLLSTFLDFLSTLLYLPFCFTFYFALLFFLLCLLRFIDPYFHFRPPPNFFFFFCVTVQRCSLPLSPPPQDQNLFPSSFLFPLFNMRTCPLSQIFPIAVKITWGRW